MPVGFKWFVPGLFDGSCCFGGEESAGASFLRHDGTVWTTDKDGLIMDLLAAEITARTGKDPGEHYRELDGGVRHAVLHAHRRAGDAGSRRRRLRETVARGRQGVDAGRRADHRQADPRPGQQRPDRRPEGRRPAAAGSRPGPRAPRTVYKIYAESFIDQAHLDAIVGEARAIVDTCHGILRSDRRGGTGVPPFPPGYRASGVLLHITSLPSAYGIGDLGPGALEWVDRLHEAGQSWWQALPLGPTGYGNSPYQSLSSFAGNELLISPDGLIEDGLLGPADCAGHAFSPTAVEYEKVVPFKLRVARDSVESLQRRRPPGSATRL